MENTLSWDTKSLINELTQGRDLVKQLKTSLDLSSSSSSSSSLSTAEILITSIISSIDKALLMVNWDKSKGGSTAIITEETMFPHSVIGGSPGSHDYNSDLIIRVNANIRRRKLPRWTDKVHAGLETGFVGPPDDGYDWRKYGQKDILGAKYPRSYYRCSNRDVQGCIAIKQVQRSNEDPSIFSITYEGRHSCIQESDLDIVNEQNSSAIYNQYGKEHNHQVKKREEKKQKKSHETVLNFQTAAGSPSQVKIKDSSHTQDELITTSSLFSLYPSTTSIIGRLDNENPIFSSSKLLDNNFKIMDSFSHPPYMSPLESAGSNFFSASNLPILDLAFFLDEVYFQTHFLLDTPRIFS